MIWESMSAIIHVEKSKEYKYYIIMMPWVWEYMIIIASGVEINAQLMYLYRVSSYIARSLIKL